MSSVLTGSRSAVALALVATLVVTACASADPSPSPSAAPTTAPSPTARPSSTDPAPTPSAETSASPTPSPSFAGVGEPPRLDLEVVVGGLSGNPLDVAVRPADPSTILVAEKEGRLRLIRDGVLVERPFLDIAARVRAGGEQGLLGVAPHPDTDDDRVFVFYTADDGRQIVASFRSSAADPDLASPRTEDRLLVMDDPFGNHNGGAMAFGPDGYLYIGTGDGGGGGDPLGSGRDLGSLLAKVLRIDVDVSAGADPSYAIPPDNPVVGRDGARPEIWLTGLRNPFRFRFDPATGHLWIGDVGQGRREEVDLAPAGVGGLDFGWNRKEGTTCYATDPCDRTGLTLPVAEYAHDEGCSVTGGAVYRGTAQPALHGWYVFSDYCSGRLWLLDAAAAAEADGLIEATLAMDSGRSLVSLAPGPDGELYATDHDAGELLRVVVAGG